MTAVVRSETMGFAETWGPEAVREVERDSTKMSQHWQTRAGTDEEEGGPEAGDRTSHGVIRNYLMQI